MSNPQDIRNQERLLPGLAMVAAAAIGSAALVRGSQSLPVRILTPLTATAVAVYYCLPDHAHWHNGSTRVPLTSATTTAAAVKHAPSTASFAAARPTSVEFEPRSTVVDKKIASAAIKQHGAVISWANTVAPKDKDKILQSAKGTSADVSKNVNRHADTVKKELSKSKDGAVKVTKDLSVAADKGAHDNTTRVKATAKDTSAAVSKGAHETAAKAIEASTHGSATATKGIHEAATKAKASAKDVSTAAVKGANETATKAKTTANDASTATTKGANETANKAKTTAKDNMAAISKGSHETGANVNATTKGASAVATKGANEVTPKVEKSTPKGPSTTAKGAHEVAVKVEKADVKTTDEMTSKSSGRKIVVDKNLAKAAAKQHDAVINRGGSQAEGKARKVHENVVDAGLPSNRQGRYEVHKIDISREASDHAGNKSVVMEIPTEERNSSRSERGL
ncbi:hypothetical protein EMPS_09552 [Entomortierella parvispora]|uniref:Uncharacterized protein n=1 Tax=Entomortierella parvispora TaxID=205924 RepID=A0A9P3HIS4_9FUNG|nr:hypothetical protein EMPS_09552 [Entomortierella parvispora]